MRSELEDHKIDKAASEAKLKAVTERLRSILGALESALDLPRGVVGMLLDATALSGDGGHSDDAAREVEEGGWPAAFGAFKQVYEMPERVGTTLRKFVSSLSAKTKTRLQSASQHLLARLRHIHDQSAASIYHARVVPMEAALADMASELKKSQAEAHDLQEQVSRGVLHP